MAIELLDVVERSCVGDDEQFIVDDVDQPAVCQVPLRIGAELLGQVDPFHLHRSGAIGGAEHFRRQPAYVGGRLAGLFQDSPDDIERKTLQAKRFNPLDV